MNGIYPVFSESEKQDHQELEESLGSLLAMRVCLLEKSQDKTGPESNPGWEWFHETMLNNIEASI